MESIIEEQFTLLAGEITKQKRIRIAGHEGLESQLD